MPINPLTRFTPEEWQQFSEAERQEIIHCRLTAARISAAERFKEQLSSIPFYQKRAAEFEARGENYWLHRAQSYTPSELLKP